MECSWIEHFNNKTECQDHFVRKIDGILYRQNVSIEFDLVRGHLDNEVYVSNSNSESIINY